MVNWVTCKIYNREEKDDCWDSELEEDDQDDDEKRYGNNGWWGA